MSMKMGWRWYGEGNDPITLGDIKQIPGVEEIVWALHSKMPGEIWEEAEIKYSEALLLIFWYFSTNTKYSISFCCTS